MRYMRKVLLLFAFIGLFATACEDNANDTTVTPEAAYLTLDKEAVTFAPEGGEVEIKVCSNYAWTSSSTCDWCTLSHTEGEANEEGTVVTLTADLTYDNREGTITFSCNDVERVLTLSQSLKEIVVADDAGVITASAKGNTVDVAYKASVACEVIIPEYAAEWILPAESTRWLEGYTVTLDIAANTTGSERTAVIKVVARDNEELFAEYTISQESLPIIEYTTTDDKGIYHLKDAFDATIISNTYTDGKGIIAFDAPVTKINDFAFQNHATLESISIPASVTCIGECAFYECASLERIHITDIAAWCRIDHIGTYAQPLIWAHNLYLGDELITDLIIPESITKIKDFAFHGCSSLKSITIPNSVTSIGLYAFRGCSALTSVTIPDSVVMIDDETFEECTALESFHGRLASEDNRCLINDGTLVAFAPAGVIEYTIPESVTSIGTGAFCYCDKLTRVTIPDNVTVVGWRAFAYCSSLESVTIGDNVTKIDTYAFISCTSLTDISIGKSVTIIENYAFKDCRSLVSITIPASVTTFEEKALSHCSKLSSVYIMPVTPPLTHTDVWGVWHAFYGNAEGRKIYVPRESVEAYKTALGWSTYADDIVGYDY